MPVNEVRPGTSLNVLGRVEYNGIQFDELINSRVQVLPVMNSQGTSVKYNKYTFIIEGIIRTPESSDGLVGGRLTAMRAQLSKEGGTFYYEDKGFGDFRINTEGARSFTPQDVTYGPIPKVLAFEPIGRGEAARVAWSVELHTYDCSGINYENLTEFWCTSKLSINKSGYQTLTRTGYIEFTGSVTRNNGNLNKNAEAQFRSLVFNNLMSFQMPGYHLTQDYNFTSNHLGINFTLAYTEIESPNPYPNGVVNIDFTHDMQSSLMNPDWMQGAMFKSWLNSMDGTIELRPNIPKVRAWAIFTMIANDRINQNAQVEFERNIKGRIVGGRIKVPIIMSLKISESIFSHKITFSVIWISFTKEIQNAFTEAGMFKQIGPDIATWEGWEGDIRGASQNPGGSYIISNLGNPSQVRRYCEPYTRLPTGKPVSTRTNPEIQYPAVYQPNCPDDRDASRATLKYQVEYIVKNRSGQKTFRRYSSGEEDVKREDPPQDRPNNRDVEMDPRFNQLSKLEDYIIQDTGNDSFKVIIRGVAVTLGSPLSAPRLKMIGKRKVKLDEDASYETVRIVNSYGPCPMYATTWELHYEILGYPKGKLIAERIQDRYEGDAQ